MERVQGVSTNYFKLLPQNSTTATPNQQIRFALPSNALINMRSLALLFQATTSGAGAGARLPAGISSLIDRYEILAGGVQISQGFSLYNVLVKAKEALEGSKCDATLGHPEIIRARSYVDGVAITGTNNEEYAPPNQGTQFGITHFEGFLGSVEPGVIDSSTLPDLTLVIYTAGNEVLSSSAGPDLQGTGAGTDITAAGTGGASYSLSGLHLNLEVIGLASAVYDTLIAKRISETGFIELPFKSYQSFVDSHTGATKFSVSCQSLDRIWVAFRTAGYDTQGAPLCVGGYKVAGAFTAATSGGNATQDVGKPQFDIGGTLNTNSEKYRGKFFNFSCMAAAVGVNPTYQMQLNGSFTPQFQITPEEVYAMSMNSVDRSYSPHMTIGQYLGNNFVQCYRLCLPGSSTRSLTGVDTRGINLMGSFNSTGVTPDTNLVIWAEMTSSLRVGANRAIEVIL